MISLPDPEGGVFLALAGATGAALVTGNLKHFLPEARQGIEVYSPQAYLARLAGVTPPARP
jgi:hypothetical protein